MKLASAIVAASSLLALAACASSGSSNDNSSSGGTDPGQDRGLEGDGVGSAASAPDKNPDGVDYPKDNIGTLPRKGSQFGNRIANLKFLGYPDANANAGLQPVSLAQYFDPSGEKYRIIHIQAAGVWCSACRAETGAVVPMKDELAARKVVWLVALVEGASPGTPSVEKDLKGWISEFKSNYTHMLDPGMQNFGPFFNAGALPWNANVDARTMEILTAGTGGVVTPEGINEEFDKVLKAADEKKFEIPQ